MDAVVDERIGFPLDDRARRQNLRRREDGAPLAFVDLEVAERGEATGFHRRREQLVLLRRGEPFAQSLGVLGESRERRLV